MASIIIPGKWTSQPQYPVKIAYEWVDVVAFASITGQHGRVDCVSGLTPTVSGTINNQGSSKGLASVPSSANATRLSYALTPISNTGNGLAMMVVANPIAAATLKRAFVLGNEAASAYNQASLIFNSTSGTVASSGRVAIVEYNSGLKAGCQSDTAAVDGKWHAYIANREVGTATYAIYVDGINRTDSPATDAGIAMISGVHVHGAPGSTTQGYAEPMVLAAVFKRQLTTVQIRALSENPWQIFRKRPQILYFDVGGGGATQDLAGAAAATAAATGALTQSVPLAAAAISVATATGALSVSIPLAGSAQAVAAASGTLTTAGTADLAGAATATATATGGLSLSIPLSGAAVAQALAAAGITHGVPLAGSAAAVAAATGALSLNISLAGNAIAQAAASAGLTVTSASSLAGAATAQASASGALSVSVPLSGAALTVSSASGSLTHIVPLAGAAAATAIATGTLDLSVPLSGAALAQALAAAGLSVEQAGLEGAATAQASASGTVTLRVNLDGDALAQASASGYLGDAFEPYIPRVSVGTRRTLITPALGRIFIKEARS